MTTMPARATATVDETSKDTPETEAPPPSPYDRFCQALFDRRLRPGQFVSQRELVALLGLSIGALRELLPRLQSEGLLRVMAQRGIMIPQIDLPMIRDAFQFRLTIEREAVLTAVQRMPDAMIAEQRALHADVVDAAGVHCDAALLKRAQRIDDRFHALLVRETGNALLVQAHAVNVIRIRLIELDRISLTANVLFETFRSHLEIIEGIAARDAEAAVAALERHLLKARERALTL
jgi:DNA-binding GntR family transcriptional regulator